MGNPKVTLLQPGWKDYTVIFGKKKFLFVGGVPKEVAPAVALVLQRMRDKKGQQRFKIENMPTIVTPIQRPKVEESPPDMDDVQNDLGDFRQGSLLECLS